MKIKDELYMRRALQLASLAQGDTTPNPLVGAVLVYQGRIIGEGYHHRSGQPHAEVMAVASVKERELLPKATLYVTLEPCAHYGKTPPCAELILRERIPRVVVAMGDPFSAVAGRGIAMLREAGVDVTLGVLEAEARELNRPFLTTQLARRPWVVLKWAQSLDGYMDALRTDASQPPVVFSSPLQQRKVHALRQRCDAILVGYRTALLDDPQLTNRLWYGANPLRVVLDRALQLPLTLRLFTDGFAPTWVLHTEGVRPSSAHLACPGVRYFALPGEELTSEDILALLHAQGLQSLLVEGGGATLQQFISTGYDDELYIEISPRILGEGSSVPLLEGWGIASKGCEVLGGSE